jgi:putative colanic acid biosynthesis acetyltransferase WcaF
VSAPNERLRIDLSRFDNSWYDPGRGLVVRSLWMVVSGFFFVTWFPWPSSLKRALLVAFGAVVGRGVVVKPRVNVKYPWKVRIGDQAWIGEGVSLDSLASITIGANVCLSQECVIETGNHDWSKPTFDLIVKEVVVEEGSWAATRSILLPGSRLASHAVLGPGSVLSGNTEPYGIYAGVPATKIKERVMRTAR